MDMIPAPRFAQDWPTALPALPTAVRDGLFWNCPFGAVGGRQRKIAQLISIRDCGSPEWE
jgi:hypothetical protein